MVTCGGHVRWSHAGSGPGFLPYDPGPPIPLWRKLKQPLARWLLCTAKAGLKLPPTALTAIGHIAHTKA